jgi:hypothetical protein
MFQRGTIKTAAVVCLVIITLGIMELGQAKPPSEERFSVLSKDPTWVLDRTTGLQWQKSPGTGLINWQAASEYCISLGNESRLPEIKELISLVDYSQWDPPLPQGHPFQGVQSAEYFSATAQAGLSIQGWVVQFFGGAVFYVNRANVYRAWCVR